MVIRILLLLLSALFLSQCAQYHIDLDQCDKTTKCFVRESCLDGHSADKVLAQRGKSDKLKTPYCDVVIQMRPFSDKKYHVMMQVNISESAETIAKSGVSLKHGDVQFACMEGGPTGKAESFNIVELGDQIYDDKLVFCSFTMELLVGNDFYNHFNSNFDFPKLEFVQNSRQTIAFPVGRARFWFHGTVSVCDPERITSSESFAEPLLQEKIDVYSFPPIECEQPKTFLTITRENAQPTVLAKGEHLICEYNRWTYQESSTPSQIPPIENIQLACTAKYCNLCDPLERLTCTAGCTPYKENEADVCMNVNCPENQWMINGGSVMKGEIACKQEIGALSSKKSYWYLNADSDPVEVEKAACFDKSICWTTQKLLLCPDKPIWECHAYNKTSDLTELFCPPGFSLTWDNNTGKHGQPSKITCDFSTGYYKDEDNNVQMKFGYSVFCAGKLIDKPQSGASQGNMGAIVGGVGGAFILLAVVGAVVIFLVRRRAATPEDAAKTVTGTEQSAVAQKTHEP